MDILELVGFLGAAFILLGFYRLHIGKWGNGSFVYELDNFAGAGLLAYYSFHRGSYPSLILNLIWVFVALRGLESWAARQNKKARQKVKKSSKRS